MRYDDEEFEVRVGRSRRERPQGFAARVRKLALQQGPAIGGARDRLNRQGLGRAAARAQALRSSARPGARRVVVKARVVKLLKGAAPAVHLRYLQRDGVTPEGGRGLLYSATDDRADGIEFLERGQGDPHQFRFIVAAEDGGELADLRAFTRDLMAQVERDLGVPLDWVAVDHFNTGHPHSHVVLRGRDGDGKPLFIAGDYIAHGLRGRASELVTLELGPETVTDLRRRLTNEVEQHRFTTLDRAILRDVGDGLDPSVGRNAFDQSVRRGRLATLERLGLARRDPGTGAWTLDDSLETTLRRLGERDDIIKTMHAAMRERGGVSAEALELHDRAPGQPITGRLLGRRLADDLGDQLAVVVEGLDGRLHHLVVAGKVEEIEAVPVGAIVSVGPAGPRPADRTISDLAAVNGGIYRASQHLAARAAERAEDPQAFVDAHVRRLEALRRRDIVRRLDADTWAVPPDYLEKAAALDAQQSRRAVMRLLSLMDLDAQVSAEGATWLDRQLVGGAPTHGVLAAHGECGWSGRHGSSRSSLVKRRSAAGRCRSKAVVLSVACVSSSSTAISPANPCK